jgi:hypothetical protein
MVAKNKAVKAVPAVTVPAAPVKKAVRAVILRKPLADAKAHNMQFAPIAKNGKPVAADVCATTKGSNPKKARVFGYDNLANGGGVPKDKRIVLVATDCPKKVGQMQWDALVRAVKAAPDAPVSQIKQDGKIQGRTIRRAYRMGAIRFAV